MDIFPTPCSPLSIALVNANALENYQDEILRYTLYHLQRDPVKIQEELKELWGLQDGFKCSHGVLMPKICPLCLLEKSSAMKWHMPQLLCFIGPLITAASELAAAPLIPTTRHQLEVIYVFEAVHRLVLKPIDAGSDLLCTYYVRNPVTTAWAPRIRCSGVLLL